jgi:non-canonical (house-cleaning) NTP pyrophosphatase
MSTRQTALPPIALGTQSALKVDAANRAFVGRAIHAYDVPTGVPEQPIGMAETKQGAMNRARAALAEDPQAEVGVGVESGMWRVNHLFRLAFVVLFAFTSCQVRIGAAWK